MLWSKSKVTSSVDATELVSIDKLEPRDVSNGIESREIEYPGSKIVLPTVLSVCLTVFLTALVSLFSHILSRNPNTAPDYCARIELLLASPCQRYQIISTPLTISLGMSLRFSLPSSPPNGLLS